MLSELEGAEATAMTSRQWLALILFFLAAYALLWLVAMEPPLEDAFISLRCAKNFYNGQGLVFNPGERVEAYSNMLWTLLLTPLTSRVNATLS